MRNLCTALTLLILCVAPSTEAQSIFTYAGGGSIDGRPATLGGLNTPRGIAVDSFGKLYIAEQHSHRVRSVDLGTGVIDTVAGLGSEGYSGDGGSASSAALAEPLDVAVGPGGDLFILDSRNYRVRKVAFRTGVISTVVGDGRFGSIGDGGAATRASLFVPTAITVDRDGNIYIIDSDKVRRVDKTTGIIDTFAGTGTAGFGGDNGPATRAQLNRPQGLAVDAAGNLFIADWRNHRVRRVDRSSRLITSVVGNGTAGNGGDGGPATLASINGPFDVWVDSAGRLLVGEGNGGRIRLVDGNGTIRTVAGKCCNVNDGIPATEAHINVDALSADSKLNIYVTDGYGAQGFGTSNGRIRRVDGSTGIISTIAGVGPGEKPFIGDGGPATSAILVLDSPVEMSRMRGLAVDRLGTLVISEIEGGRVRAVEPVNGTISTIGGGIPAGVAADSENNIYWADVTYHEIHRYDRESGTTSLYAGRGSPSSSGDGGPATRAGIGTMGGLAFDSSDNLHLIDSNSVRRIDATTGIISTVVGDARVPGFSGDGGPATAARFNLPSDIAFDTSGNLYIADSFNHRIRRVDGATNVTTTVAGSSSFGFGGDGGMATSAKLFVPVSVAVDPSGNVFIADRDNFRIRRVDGSTRRISTYAGIGSLGLLQGGFSGDGGPATKAGLAQPDGVAVDENGTLYVMDSGANRVRVIYACRAITPTELASPSDGSTGLPSQPLLVWKPVQGAFRYDLYLDTVSPPRALAGTDLEGTSFSPSNLSPLTVFYWKVVAKGDPFCRPFRTSESEVRSFTTTSECKSPGE